MCSVRSGRGNPNERWPESVGNVCNATSHDTHTQRNDTHADRDKNQVHKTMANKYKPKTKSGIAMERSRTCFVTAKRDEIHDLLTCVLSRGGWICLYLEFSKVKMASLYHLSCDALCGSSCGHLQLLHDSGQSL